MRLRGASELSAVLTYPGVMIGGRRVAAILGAVLVALVLTGCVDVAVTSSVSAQGTFTGQMSSRFDKAAMAEFGITDAAQAEQELGAPATDTGPVTVAWSSDDSAFVQTVTYTDATSAQIESALTATRSSSGPDGSSTTTTSVGFPLTARVEDGLVVVRLRDEVTEAGDEAADQAGGAAADQLLQALYGDSAVTLTVQMPAPVALVSGVLPAATKRGVTVTRPDDRTVQVSAGFAALAELARRAGSDEGLVITSPAPPGSATPAPTPANATPAASGAEPAAPEAASPSPVLLAGGALAALVVAGGVAALIIRSRR